MQTTLTLTIADQAVDRVARLEHISYGEAATRIREMCADSIREVTAGCTVSVCNDGSVGTFPSPDREDEDWQDEIRVSL